MNTHPNTNDSNAVGKPVVGARRTVPPPPGPASGSARVAYLQRRLSIHRRRLKYWSGNPSFTGYGPTGKKLRRSHMDLQYELAKCDAEGIAMELKKLGVDVKVVDVRRTFQCRWSNPAHEEILVWPNNPTEERP